VFCDDGSEREMGDHHGNDIKHTRGYEKSGIRAAVLVSDDLVSVFSAPWSGVLPAVSGTVN